MKATFESDGDGRLRLRGPLDIKSVTALWKSGLEELDQGGVLEVDLAGVERTDSAGVALLLDWTRRAIGAGGRLRLHHVPEQMLAIVRASGVEQVLEIADEPG